jgi:hypothetical protein
MTLSLARGGAAGGREAAPEVLEAAVSTRCLTIVSHVEIAPEGMSEPGFYSARERAKRGWSIGAGAESRPRGLTRNANRWELYWPVQRTLSL